MGHTLHVNTSKKPIKHPVTGQEIPGGFSYTVPDEDELKAQEKMQKGWEKTNAKATADAEEAAKKAEEEKAKQEAEEAVRLEEERKRHEELLQQQNSDGNTQGAAGQGDA